MENKLIVSYAPHIHGKENITKIMRDVIIAMVPCILGAIYFYGLSALITMTTSVAFCVLFEYVWDRLTKKENTTKDLSAIVTGMLLAFSLPPQIPLYMVIIGDAFAIIIVKCFYGGIGQNFINPALGARAFLLACYPMAMTTYTKPGNLSTFFSSSTDAISSATPLSVIKQGGEVASYKDLFFGNIPGCIGEVSVLLILIGALYLLLRRVINLVTPLTYIVSVGLFGMLFTDYDFLFHILSGGIFLAGFFMLTDYATSPVTKLGQFIYALGAGLITVVIRVYGGYPEGVTYAVLIMNILTPLLDKYITPRVFGKAVKQSAK